MMYGTTLLLLVAAAQAKPQETEQEREASRDLLRSMSLDEMLQVRVTTPAQKEQPVLSVPAAISVLQGQDLRRAGVRNLPDALRLVPGMNVARLDGDRWAVSARGFNDFASNKLQVMLDGRSLYTHTFSGIIWGRQNIPIDEIERIEVIRGPGGATWGSNAMNGVVNIITKECSQTQGLLLLGGGGTEERLFASARSGASAEGGFSYRVYAGHFQRDTQLDGFDDAMENRAGMRLDWASPDHATTLSLSAETFESKLGLTVQLASPTPPVLGLYEDRADTTGGYANLSARHAFSTHSSLSGNLSYDITSAHTVFGPEFREEFQVGFHHQFQLAESHDVVWGAAYRLFHDRQSDQFTVMFDPKEKTEGYPSLFLQDEITLIKDRLRFLLGSTLEYNHATRVEYQPTARLTWTPDEDVTLWASVSRAVRTPSRSDREATRVVTVIPGAPNRYVSAAPDEDFRSEEVLAYEAGVRAHLHPAFFADLAGFVNVYDRLASTERLPGASVQPYGLLITSQKDNGLHGTTVGGELALEWRPADWTRFRGSVTLLRMNLDEKDGSLDTTTEATLEGSSARAQSSFWASLDLPWHLQADVIVRYSSQLAAFDLDAYVETDARLSWNGLKHVEIGLVGQNLSERHHPEFGQTVGIFPTDVERGVYAYVALRF